MQSFSNSVPFNSQGYQHPGSGAPDSATGSGDPRRSGADPGTGERPQAGLAPTPSAFTLHALSAALARSVPEVCSDCRSVWQQRHPSGEELDQIARRVQEILRRFREHRQ